MAEEQPRYARVLEKAMEKTPPKPTVEDLCNALKILDTEVGTEIREMWFIYDAQKIRELVEDLITIDYLKKSMCSKLR
jgi:beta-phosphoglucomutase-like phosphatase (HAD superfamily)